MKSQGFVFILTPMDLLCSPGLEIIPGHRIARADEAKITQIKAFIEHFNTDITFTSPYEHNVRSVQGNKPGNVRTFWDTLAPENWRYWIIEFEGTNSELGELGAASAIIPNDLELGFYFILNGKGFGWDATALGTFFLSDICKRPVKMVTQDDLMEIGMQYHAIKALSSAHADIRRALGRFRQLLWLPRNSEMAIIGLFSVIESLVSHAPKLKESADSISHQVQTKIPMLMRRFHPDFDEKKYSHGTSGEKLWKALYGYRSAIVHGNDSRLDRNPANMQKIELVIDFLREISKRLLRLSLAEPQFMGDLKKC